MVSDFAFLKIFTLESFDKSYRALCWPEIGGQPFTRSVFLLRGCLRQKAMVPGIFFIAFPSRLGLAMLDNAILVTEVYPYSDMHLKHSRDTSTAWNSNQPPPYLSV